MTALPDCAVGVDVGGTTIKAALVAPATGALVAPRAMTTTPRPATPSRVLAEVVGLARALAPAADTPVGVTLPGVVRGGVVGTAANIDPAWIGFDARAALADLMPGPVRVVNDADAAGVAEAAFGAARDHAGVVLVTTLGTGIGSALLLGGSLLPNTELGHLEIDGTPAERRAATSALHREELGYRAWAERLTTYYRHLELLLAPDLIVVGGAVSASADEFLPHIDIRTPITAATLGNDAGAIGAALLAASRDGTAQPAYWGSVGATHCTSW